jgi:peptidoglycan-N-acetylglucosamine deacetylase
MTFATSTLRSQLATVQQQLVGAVTHVHTREPLVALTFDDGPHPDFTPRLLHILADYGAHATFFMVGRAAEQEPGLVQEVIRAGHVIGNHSWDHRPMTSLESWRRKQNIRVAQEALGAQAQRLFRPPYGIQSFAANMDARKMKCKLIAWSLDVEDWLDPDESRMSERLVRGIRPGAIVLLHDALYDAAGNSGLQADRTSLLEAVRRTLDQLSKTYRFVSVPEIMDAGTPVSRLWSG